VRTNDEAAALLAEYADLLAITGGDAFRIRSYEKAARSVGGYPEDLARVDPAELDRIPNVGRAIAAKIRDYLGTGQIRQLEALRAKVPAGVRRLTEVPGLGPKRAMILFTERGIDSVDALEAAIAAGRLEGLPGFGAKSEENLLRGIELIRKSAGRVRIDTATDLAEELLSRLSAVPGCTRCTYAGSLRRMRDTIGDVDILAVAADPAALMAAFRELPLVAEVIAGGDAKTSIRTTDGIQADLRVVPEGSWGAALQYFTGSQAHNVRLREMAVARKLKLSEYGLFDTGHDTGTGACIAAATEEEVYQALGLPWIPPPLREDSGEIEAARRGELPVLVTEADLRGDLHTHTNLTDGVAPLAGMVAAAAARGYAYYAVTDHAPNLFMQRMTDEKMLAQRAEVRRLDGQFGGMRLLHGTELNIGPDGEVDWPAEFLDGFDLCVASVHSHFTQPQEEMTRRMLRAIDNPHVAILGHPTTRLIGRRPPVDVDLDAVYQACARTGTAIEIDAFPDRLDLSAEHVRLARRHGVKFSIDSDAHAVGHLAVMRYGIGTAQRGWLSPDEVINTWPWPRLMAFLQAKRGT
jgi:DNA polymerase (family 10)